MIRSVVFFCCAAALSGQYSTSERIVLPADKTEADIVLMFEAVMPPKAKITASMVDADGTAMTPQPKIGEAAPAKGQLTLHISDIFFFGEAKLRVPLGGKKPDAIYTVQRGAELKQNEVQIRLGHKTELWLYNFGNQPLSFRWRIVAMGESSCGVDSKGEIQVDCSTLDHWPEAKIGPARSDSISFLPREEWWNLFGHEEKGAFLELSYGSDDASPLQRIPLILRSESRLTDFFSTRIGSPIEVFLGVTVGSVLLMLAQVILPNFRKCIGMETQLGDLHERLRAIGSRVSTRLYSRCEQEIQSVKARGLGRPGFGTFFLSGDTSEVSRLATILVRIDARVKLTERLDEIQTAVLNADSSQFPPSYCWSRRQLLRSVEMILSRQFITDADQKSATESLDLLMDNDAALKNFKADLETRIAALRRSFAAYPWNTKPDLVQCVNGGEELMKATPDKEKDVDWTPAEIIQRDLTAVRLEIVEQMMGIECLVSSAPEKKAVILEKLKSDDPAQLAHARDEVLKLSQGISEADVRTALEKGLWDAWFEPDEVLYQDVVRRSFVFRNRDINGSTAKNAFQCYWSLSEDGEAPITKVKEKAHRRTKGLVPSNLAAEEAPREETPAESNKAASWEKGWEIQFIPGKPKMRSGVEVYDADGHPVNIRPTSEPADKGVQSFEVIDLRVARAGRRTLRGLMDAFVTAIVPVITVVVTQVQGGGHLSFFGLVALGFGSQAIRAAVVPESVTQTPDPPVAKPGSSAPQ